MKNTPRKNEFNPSGVGLKNGNFIGLPFTEDSANIVLIPVPWDVTVSYGEGTALAPQAILEASVQLDLYDADVKDAWKQGIFMQPLNENILEDRNEVRPQAAMYIDFLENGGSVTENVGMKSALEKINNRCEELNNWVYRQSKSLLEQDKLVGIVGGDHGVPLGFIKALSEKYADFGVLQIDAHMDLRNSYEGFTYSHASIFNNALELKSISKLVQVGIRDYCEEEVERVIQESERISVFYDQQIKENIFNGSNWNQQCEEIIKELPKRVYISFDIDGLDPKLCPITGTPVPGGLEFSEATFLIKKLVESGRNIIGFDVCEVGNNDWDASVGARIIYKLCNLMGKSW
ncbi:MAG: agmatinase family protein [Bacteroidetes bacterium]|nr:agmatinase family protein [Bacteroidota bacterium]